MKAIRLDKCTCQWDTYQAANVGKTGTTHASNTRNARCLATMHTFTGILAMTVANPRGERVNRDYDQVSLCTKPCLLQLNNGSQEPLTYCLLVIVSQEIPIFTSKAYGWSYFIMAHCALTVMQIELMPMQSRYEIGALSGQNKVVAR